MIGLFHEEVGGKFVGRIENVERKRLFPAHERIIAIGKHSSQIANVRKTHYRHIATGFVCSKSLLSYLNNLFSRNETN